jgi:1-acyl-sn-glycerol-3-phosphate acyltransferase
VSTGAKIRFALTWVRSIFFQVPLIWLYTVIMGTLSLLSSFFDRGGRMQHWFARTWSRMIMTTAMSPVKVLGLEKVDITKPHMYAVNHLSALDIPAVFGYLPFQFRVMAKEELFRYPFMGWHMRRSGQIAVERSSARASMRGLNLSAQTLKEGMPLLVFPEGGRSANGQVKPFLSGVFYAAIKAQVEVVPMALVGTYELLPMNTFHIHPRPVELLIGEPIPTTEYTPRDAEKLAVKVQTAVEDLYYSRSEVADPRTKSAATSPAPVEART